MDKFNQTPDQKQVEGKNFCTPCINNTQTESKFLSSSLIYPKGKEQELRNSFTYSELLAFKEILTYDDKESMFENCKKLLLLNFEENDLDKELRNFLVTIFTFFEALHKNKDLC